MSLNKLKEASMRIQIKLSRVHSHAIPRSLAAAGLLFFCVGSAQVIAQNHGSMMTSTAVLVATSGSTVSGTLKFHEAQNRVVHIAGTVEGLAPGKHGFHVHVNGNCDSPDGMSAGGHYAPTGGKHGAPGSNTRHLGDLGNIVADAKGRAEVDVTVSGITIALMGTASIGDRSIVIHAKEDDFSDPAGNSGARVACGVIESDMMRM